MNLMEKCRKGIALLAFVLLAASFHQPVQAQSLSQSLSQSLREAACYLVDGKTNCKRVKVVDAESCLVKIYPFDMPLDDPESMGCLIEDLQTKTVSFKQIKSLAVRTETSKTGLDQIGTLVLKGDGDALSVLAAYNDHGGPEWSNVQLLEFSVKGTINQTRFMIEKIQTRLCTRQSKLIVAERTQLLSKSKPQSPVSMNVRDAHTKSKNGDILLIDVRRPSEWRQTGIAESAQPITMHQEIRKFVDQLKAAQIKAGNKPIAVICATGGRSAFLQRTLPKFGINNVIDVSEGMLGSASGDGWLKSGLPVKSVN